MASGYRFVSSEFTIPSWDAVKEHEEYGARWSPASVEHGELTRRVETARRDGRLLTAHLENEAGLHRPYCMTASTGTAFFYPLHVEGIEVEGQDGLQARYCHYATPPTNPEVFYTIDEGEAEGMDELFRFPDERWLLKTDAPGSPSIIHVGSPGEPVNDVLLRVSVILQIFDAIDAGRQPRALLPYHQDTPRIGLQRMNHVQKWQFENAPTRPLFA